MSFQSNDSLSAIPYNELFVFAIPLAIGLLHSIFAVKAASALTLSDIYRNKCIYVIMDEGSDPCR
ncbi:hypothetical protein FPZ45_18315 [Cohnella terricola]|uniref:Uncharacterized protein n=1 Tax=Cohnella terricola TaxID=1289167 RepID=A0A559JCX9_9BACL|nr:hypothetical protein FPZ45_18315 [Cohnella terricola]